MKIILLPLLLAMFCLSQPAMAQASAKKSKKEAMELLVQAKEQMALENYSAANNSFRKMLELNTVLPTEMCYFFANTLYHLQQFDNSLRFVEKYESLAGTGGEYYQENLQLKKLLDKEIKIIRECKFCDSQGYVLEECHLCEGEGTSQQACMKCYGHKETKCKTCKGEGVVIQTNHFGQKNYQTCQLCQGSGIMDCTHCKGEGKLTQNCQYCNGTGKVRQNQLCTHPHRAN